MGRLAQDVKPPGERTRKTMPLLLSDAGMGLLVAFFKCLRNAPKKANLQGILVDEKLPGPN